jgi:hypothetical protein
MRHFLKKKKKKSGNHFFKDVNVDSPKGSSVQIGEEQGSLHQPLVLGTRDLLLQPPEKAGVSLLPFQGPWSSYNGSGY